MDSPTRPANRTMLVKRLVGLALAAALGTTAWAAPYAWMAHREAGKMFGKLDAIDPRPVAVVFGALVYKSGNLSPVLRGRVDAAVALYRAGKVQKLLMTGDNGSNHYDEVTPMKRYAVSLGVPPEKIVRDFAGFRTFDSCYRAKHIFGVNSAILVTQAYHLPRALYLAHKIGIDAVGFVAPNCSSANQLAGFQRREATAAILAIVDTDLLKRKPRLEGRPEPVIGDDRPNR